jgi:hypothetical protein
MPKHSGRFHLSLNSGSTEDIDVGPYRIGMLIRSELALNCLNALERSPLRRQRAVRVDMVLTAGHLSVRYRTAHNFSPKICAI